MQFWWSEHPWYLLKVTERGMTWHCWNALLEGEKCWRLLIALLSFPHVNYVCCNKRPSVCWEEWVIEWTVISPSHSPACGIQLGTVSGDLSCGAVDVKFTAHLAHSRLKMFAPCFKGIAVSSHTRIPVDLIKSHSLWIANTKGKRLGK